MSIWTNEDGDVYFAEGHIKDDEMRRACIAAERRWLKDGYPDPPDLEEEILSGSVSHHWIINCEWNDEATHEVAEGTPNAEPITRLQR